MVLTGSPPANLQIIDTMKANLHGLKAIAILLFVFAARPAALANTELWIGVSGMSITTNWSDNANWSNLTGGGTPGPNGNDVIFGDIGAVGGAGIINSVVDQNGLNPLSLVFTNRSQSGNFHSMFIPAGDGDDQRQRFDGGREGDRRLRYHGQHDRRWHVRAEWRGDDGQEHGSRFANREWPRWTSPD